MDNLGIYISVPFCRSKCTYCNFASGVFPSSYFDRYVARVEDDLRLADERAVACGAVLPRHVDTVYLGGGTPSLLPPELMERLLGEAARNFEVSSDAEITVECAPGQLADETLAAMVAGGVNRVSFGVQSFVDAEAKHTGRLHTREMALGDVERVRKAGIRSVNVDLIAGLPGQSRESWRESLDVLTGAGVDHASVYMLEVDEDSRLGREVGAGGLRYYAPQVPSDDAVTEMYAEAVGISAEAGLAQYEISNFARKGAESRHNLKYWRRQPYLGVGLDAHSMLRDQAGRALRFGTTDGLDAYLNASGWEDCQRLAAEDELEEAFFLGLRLNAGVDLSALRAEFGEGPVRGVDAVLAELEDDGLLTVVGDGVALTERGRLLSNEVFAQFLRETAAV
jgi:oxygen-independent coproporphyrinogen-3 oxidase